MTQVIIDLFKRWGPLIGVAGCLVAAVWRTAVVECRLDYLEHATDEWTAIAVEIIKHKVKPK